MKVRQGFVSNSSSSNFIVAFPRVPKTVREMATLLFGKEKFSLKHPFLDKSYSGHAIADKVLKDLKNRRNRLTSPDAIAVQFSHSSLAGMPPYPNGDSSPEELRDYEKKCYEVSTMAAAKFIESNKGCVFHLFRYGSEVGSSELEDGKIFKKLNHFRINNH